MSLSVHTATETCSLPCQPSTDQYNSLKYKYNAEHVFSSNGDLPVINGTTPLYDRLNHCSNNDSFISSSSFLEMHLNNSTDLLSKANSIGNNMPQADSELSGDVQDNQFSILECNHSTDTQMKSECETNESTHKVAVFVKQDGTGIVQTGTLQALIPSSRSDENYIITPSQSYQSYVDVKITTIDN